MEKKKLPELQISELYLVKVGSDWTRTYMATIVRETDADGLIIRGKVYVKGEIWSTGRTEEELGNKLDYMCLLKLDYGIHCLHAAKTIIGELDCFLN